MVGVESKAELPAFQLVSDAADAGPMALIVPETTYRRDEIGADRLGQQIRFAVALSVAGETMTLEFTGTSPQVSRGINFTFNMVANPV
jgi:N-methylhydantoinase B/oxoprolinase/acetone carboxylase alpha subunit